MVIQEYISSSSRGRINTKISTKKINNKNKYVQELKHISLKVENQLLKRQIQEYESLLNVFPQGCLIVQGGKIAYLNTMAYQLMGYRVDEPIVGRKLEEFLAPEDRARVMRHLAASRGEKDKGRWSFFLLPKSGNTRVKSELLTTSVSYRGQPAAYLVIRDDPEEIGNLSKAILRSKAILQKTLDTINDGIVVLDRDYNVVIMNRKSLAVCGESEFGKVIGKPCYAVFHKSSAPCPDCPVRYALGAGESPYSVERKISRDGQDLTYQLFIFPIFEDGQMELLVKYQRDVSRERRLQEQLIQSEKLAMLGVMAGVVSHEINNPLTSIIGMAQVMASQNVGEQESLDLIIKEGLRIKKLVQNLTSLSRPRHHEPSEVFLNEVIETALAVVQNGLGQLTNCKIERKYLSDSPVIFADRDQIEQVFLNLLINAAHALKASPGKRLLAVGTKISPDGKYAIGYVSDNGCGIAEADKPRIFEPFFTTKKEGEGTGLGLSVVKEIVDKHHGLIEFESRIGQGSRFEIYLPLLARQ